MRNTSSIEKPLMMKVPTRKMFPLMLNPLRGNRILLETLILETTPKMILKVLKEKESVKGRRPNVKRKPKRPGWKLKETVPRTRTAICRAPFPTAASTRMTKSKWLWGREKEEKFKSRKIQIKVPSYVCVCV
ncbi:uncharacterized protein LOC124207522 [Daphnia pulex]|uniref:uncharacterized protein LOC124207522 n=1 Tax=Daphnia pulex TaxID=6669 RepID=UPI001EDFD7FC|nr:uncharacterized protein LOC124207522 [Daphnia pulex]